MSTCACVCLFACLRVCAFISAHLCVLKNISGYRFTQGNDEDQHHPPLLRSLLEFNFLVIVILSGLRVYH